MGSTVLLAGAFILMHDVDRIAVSVGISFDGAGIDVDFASCIVLVTSHADPFRAKGSAVGVQFDTLFIEEMGIDLFAVF